MAWRHVDDQLTQNRFTYPSTNYPGTRQPWSRP
jgi:hypothetical protein